MTRLISTKALGPLGILILAGTSMAQQSVVEHCRNTSSDADRIACLEAALLGKEANDVPTVTPAVAPTVTPAITPAVTPAAAEAPTGIGAEQVVARTQSDEERIERLEKAKGLVVASYKTVPYEKLQVTLENGQVWRQIKGDTQKIRVDLKRNQTVDIAESSLSGYKLQLNEMRRSVRVERIR